MYSASKKYYHAVDGFPITALRLISVDTRQGFRCRCGRRQGEARRSSYQTENKKLSETGAQTYTFAAKTNNFTDKTDTLLKRVKKCPNG